MVLGVTTVLGELVAPCGPEPGRAGPGAGGYDSRAGAGRTVDAAVQRFDTRGAGVALVVVRRALASAPASTLDFPGPEWTAKEVIAERVPDGSQHAVLFHAVDQIIA